MTGSALGERRKRAEVKASPGDGPLDAALGPEASCVGSLSDPSWALGDRAAHESVWILDRRNAIRWTSPEKVCRI